VACPHCARRLKLTCQRCRSALRPEWRLCPYCEAPTPTQQQRTMTLYETQS
jgi:RNA polymerase subunit RPABC4/transcription elongation factor Spt4